MKKIIIDQAFWDVFPEGQIEVLVVEGINNKGDAEDYQQLLNSAVNEAKQHVLADSFTDNQVINDWRVAFSQIKTKKGARSSIEALLKRVSQGREFGPISPIVDIYNSISLRFGVPCGAEDIMKLEGDLHLGTAKGGEQFFPLGADSDSPALENEMIYYDQSGAVCRSLNWREAKRTMITEQSQNCVFVLEATAVHQHENLHTAAVELSDLLSDKFEVEVRAYTLTEKESSAIIKQ